MFSLSIKHCLKYLTLSESFMRYYKLLLILKTIRSNKTKLVQSYNEDCHYEDGSSYYDIALTIRNYKFAETIYESYETNYIYSKLHPKCLKDFLWVLLTQWDTQLLDNIPDEMTDNGIDLDNEIVIDIDASSTMMTNITWNYISLALNEFYDLLHNEVVRVFNIYAYSENSYDISKYESLLKLPTI